MSNHLHYQKKQYTQAISAYRSALEHGDIETVAMLLQEAERDAMLEQMLLATNISYQKNKRIVPDFDEVKQAQEALLNAFSSTEDVHTQINRKQRMQVQPFIQEVHQERRLPTTLTAKHFHRFSNLAQTLVAVFVVGLLVGSFALLFASRHHTTVGSGQSGVSGYTTLSHSIVVASSADGIVFGMRPDTGAVVWRHEVGKSTNTISSTLTVQGQVVYFAQNEQIYALHTIDGTLIWHKTLNIAHSVQTNYVKIVVEKGIVFLSGDAYGNGLPGGILYALWAQDGRVLWSYQKGGSNPLLTVHNDIVYVEKIVDDHGHKAVQALKANDGSLFWSYTTQVMAVVANDTNVYVYSGHPIEDMGRDKQDKTLLALDTKGTLLWTRPVVDDGVNSLVIAQGVLIVGEIDGKIYHVCAYRTSSGTQAWCSPNETLPLASNTNSYVVLGNTLYSSVPVMSSGTDTLSIDTYSVSDGSLLWSSRIVENFASGKLVAFNGSLFLLGYHKVYALEGSSGRIHWQLVNNATTFSTIAVGSL